jgi:hypothetical protein
MRGFAGALQATSMMIVGFLPGGGEAASVPCRAAQSTRLVDEMPTICCVGVRLLSTSAPTALAFMRTDELAHTTLS